MNQPIRKRLYSGAAGTLALTVRRATTLTAARAAVTLFLAVLTTATAWADDVSITADGSTVSDATTWTDCTVNVTGSGTVTFSNRITISGTVTLNLGTGATLTASKGIAVHEGNSLTIDGTGTLNAYIAYQQYNDAAIGGGNGSNAGTIIINGGTINAYGKYNGAAIGGGYNGNGGNIIINGGTVNADSKTNKSKGAGIGGGFVGDGNVGDGGNITINGGTITAKSFNGTGIGGGYNGNGGIITITGGNITATAGNYSAGIGGGCFGNAGTISITGGVINVSCGEYGAGIGGGGTSDSTTSAGGGGTIAISGGQITVTSSGGYGIGAGKSDYGNDGAEGTISLSWSESTDFISASSYVGDINFVAGKRFYYYETTDYATKDGMYKQNRKIVPAIGEVSSLAMAEIRMPRYYITTSGTAVNVDYSVYDYNENELTLGTDYTAVIRNSSNAEVTTFDQLGDYTLTVTGKGAYTGSKSYTFSLVEIDPGLTQDGSEYYVNFPNPGRETISLSSGQTIKVYDSEGKSGNVVAGDGFLMLYAPEGCALEVTGKIDAIHYDSGTGVYTNSLNAYEGEDESVQITSIDRNSESISFASGGNKMLLRFYAPIVYTGHYGLDLTVRVIQATPHTVTKGTCTNGDITIDKTSANTNETVTLTVNPASGYLLKRITITDTDNSTTLSTIGEDNWYSEENTVTFKMPSKNVTVTPEFTNDLTATNGLALQIDPLRVKAYTIPEIAKSFNITGSANNNSSTTAVLKAHEGYRLQATGNVDFIGSKYDDSEITIYDGANTSATLLTNIKGKNQDVVSIGTQTSSSNYMTIYLYEDEHNAVFTGKISIAPIQYSIGYDLAGGSVATENPTTFTIESDAITLTNPTRDYYTFAGWTGTDLDAASTSVTIAKGSYGNRSYTATWKPIDYTITYNGVDGATFATANPATYTIESDAITLNNPTREGYTFAGWTGTGLDAATTNVTIAAGSSGNREYTATWTAIEYSIKYNGLDGATFSTTYNSYTIESADIALDTPAKTGYDFGGWYANSGLTGSAVTTIAAGSYGDIELWAKWTASENINLAANQAPDGNCWTTFYCGDAGYTIDDGENACAYTATYSDGKLTLHNQGKTIAKGEAVIIVADNNEVSMTKGADGTKSDDNDLHGVDVETSRDDIQTTLGEGTFYVLGMTNGNFGFHKYTGATMAARKAFVLVGGSNAALARSLTMVFGDETGIISIDNGKLTIDNEAGAWYSLDGRRLQGKPSANGVYINNGKKIVIK